MSQTKEIYDGILQDLESCSVSVNYNKDKDTVMVHTDEGVYHLKVVDFEERSEE